MGTDLLRWTTERVAMAAPDGGTGTSEAGDGEMVVSFTGTVNALPVTDGVICESHIIISQRVKITNVNARRSMKCNVSNSSCAQLYTVFTFLL